MSNSSAPRSCWAVLLEESPSSFWRLTLTELCFLFQQSTLKMDIEDCNGRSYISGMSDLDFRQLFWVANVLRCSVSSSGYKLPCAWLLCPRLCCCHRRRLSTEEQDSEHQHVSLTI